MTLSTEAEIRAAYGDRATASQYVAKRFVSAPHRLLHRKQVAAVQRVIDSMHPKRTLEIAPGPGRLTQDVRPGGTFIALEYNHEMIDVGRSACAPAVNWIRGNAFQLPFPEALFDFVYSFRFVRHFQLADRQRLYSGIRRTLRRGGYFIMDAVNARISRPLRARNPEEYPIFDEQYLANELINELTEAGFEGIQLEPVQRCFGWQCRSQVLLGPRIPWMNRIIVNALERLPTRDGLEWIVTCRRA